MIAALPTEPLQNTEGCALLVSRASSEKCPHHSYIRVAVDKLPPSTEYYYWLLQPSVVAGDLHEVIKTLTELPHT
jgi:hypothetical protein